MKLLYIFTVSVMKNEQLHKIHYSCLKNFRVSLNGLLVDKLYALLFFRLFHCLHSNFHTKACEVGTVQWLFFNVGNTRR